MKNKNKRMHLTKRRSAKSRTRIKKVQKPKKELVGKYPLVI